MNGLKEGVKAKLITDVTSRALRKEDLAVACRLFRTNSLMEGAL
jgi:hypothetical protein